MFGAHCITNIFYECIDSYTYNYKLHANIQHFTGQLCQRKNISHSTSLAQVEPSFLHVKAQEFYANGLAASTLNTYLAGQIRFTNFC